MSPRVLGAVVAIVVLGGGIIGYLMFRASGEAEARVSKVLRAVDAELNADEIDRDSLSDVLKDVERLQVESPSPALTRAEALIQLALGRTSAAWETISFAATSPEGSPEDRWAGARIAARLHAEGGESHVGSQAMSLCRESAQDSMAPEVLFLLWQVAYRTDSVEDWLDAYASMKADGEDSLEARTAERIGYFLAFHIADRIGIEGDAARLDELASDENAEPAVRLLCAFIRDNAEASKSVTEQELLKLDMQWGESPPELAVLLARAQLSKASAEDGRPDELHAAVEILKNVLEVFPTFVEARHLIAVAHYGLHEATLQKAHLRWLVENAPETDTRRASWHRQL